MSLLLWRRDLPPLGPGHTLKGLKETVPKEWLRVIGEVEEPLEFLPPEGDKRLHALWKQLAGRRSGRGQALRALEQQPNLLLRLSQRWQEHCTFQSEPEVPWTNNGTERAIGRMKMRARTVRGYKTWQGMQTGLLLTGLLNFWIPLFPAATSCCSIFKNSPTADVTETVKIGT